MRPKTHPFTDEERASLQAGLAPKEAAEDLGGPLFWFGFLLGATPFLLLLLRSAL